MLCRLLVRDFALVESVELEFFPGLTVLVGETGAGKSIIMDALAAALGSRVSTDMIRKGARKFLVEATFSINNATDTAAYIRELGAEWESNELILRKELSVSGTSRHFVNDTPQPTSVVREIATLLMDFHSQHDTLGLLDRKRHQGLLDGAGNYGDMLLQMQDVHHRLRNAQKRLTDLEELAETSDRIRAEQSELLTTINSINPRVGEIEQLEMELRRAEQRELVLWKSAEVRNMLFDADESVYNNLSQVAKHIKDLQAFDSEMATLLPEIESACEMCKEAVRLVSTHTESADFSPDHIEHLRQRIAVLQKIHRRFGSLEEALKVRTHAEHVLERLDSVESQLESARADLDIESRKARDLAAALTENRKQLAQRLEREIQKRLSEMGMPSARVQFHIAPTSLTSTGADEVQILFAAHRGADLKPIHKVASGGELSRFMLSLKSALASAGGLGTVVLDEIDTGISGRIARNVGMVMHDLSKRTQVICITHLPQIASLAEHMIAVEKSESDDSVRVVARHINADEAVTEVARLLSGSRVTEAALQSARDLMQGERADSVSH